MRTIYDHEPEYSTYSICANEPNAWEHTQAMLRVLLESGYEARVRLEEGISYIVEFGHSPEKDFGNDRLMWVSVEEEERIALDRIGTDTDMGIGEEDEDEDEDKDKDN